MAVVVFYSSYVGSWIVRGRENGVLTKVVVVVWDDDGGGWYYYCEVRCDVCT